MRRIQKRSEQMGVKRSYMRRDRDMADDDTREWTGCTCSDCRYWDRPDDDDFSGSNLRECRAFHRPTWRGQSALNCDRFMVIWGN